jgi:hypothetical protein
METVVAGQLGSGPGAWHRVSALRGQREDAGEVGVGAAGQGHVGLLTVLIPGEHRHGRMDGPALRDVAGDRVPELGVPVVRVQERLGGPLALPGGRVGVQGPADEQATGGDGVNAEQVPAGQGSARAARPRRRGRCWCVIGGHQQRVRAAASIICSGSPPKTRACWS